MIKIGNALFIVESPLQLLCAYEAVHFFKPDGYKIFVRYSAQKINDLQLDKLVDLLFTNDAKHIKKIHIRSQNKSIIDFAKIIYFKFLLMTQKFDHWFLGNVDSGFIQTIVKNVDKKNIILLDDGSKTLVIQKRFKPDYYFDLFTLYKLEPVEQQIIHKNNFVQLRQKLNTGRNEDQVLFIGAKLSEVDVISEQKYLQLMQNVARYFNQKQILYIAHRGEDANKLKRIGEIANIEVETLDFPIELWGFYKNELPNQIASFFSTALYSMHKMYDIECISFKFDYQHHAEKADFDTVYDYHAKVMTVLNEADYA